MSAKNTNINFSLKSMREDGSFSGYASVFGIVDLQNDIIIQGAFAHSISGNPSNIKLLWQHQVDIPIGVFTTIIEDTYGLYVEGRLLMDVAKGREAYSLLKNGAINGLSIGYNVIESSYNDESNIRMITDLNLWEISLVTFPANENAVVISVKNAQDVLTETDSNTQLLRAIDCVIEALKNNRSLSRPYLRSGSGSHSQCSKLTYLKYAQVFPRCD